MNKKKKLVKVGRVEIQPLSDEDLLSVMGETGSSNVSSACCSTVKNACCADQGLADLGG